MPIDVVFSSDHPEYNDKAEVFATRDGYLCIQVRESDDPRECQTIFLNKANAIRFAKEVRKQISFMEDGQDGR